jgi:hypothetical protein
MIIEYTSNLTGNPVQVVKQDVDYDIAELDPFATQIRINVSGTSSDEPAPLTIDRFCQFISCSDCKLEKETCKEQLLEEIKEHTPEFFI